MSLSIMYMTACVGILRPSGSYVKVFSMDGVYRGYWPTVCAGVLYMTVRVRVHCLAVCLCQEFLNLPMRQCIKISLPGGVPKVCMNILKVQ